MRFVTGLCCAIALAVSLGPSARADEYTKQTYLTFSGPVQVPGVTLPAGTYMLKLADPESGRRVIQIWDKEGAKLYTTLLTIPNDRMEAPDEPVVMFAERPAGQAPAVKAWFYPGERTGQEFIYPKDQAMKIAKITHTSVLSTDAKDNDEASLKSGKVTRVDENGNAVDDNAQAAKSDRSDTTTSGATTTTASSATTTTAGSTTTTASAADTDTAASKPTAAAAPVGATGTRPSTTARADTTEQRASSEPAARQSSREATGTTGTLPSTASNLELIQLLSALSLGGAVAVRRLRKHFVRA